MFCLSGLNRKDYRLTYWDLQSRYVLTIWLEHSTLLRARKLLHLQDSCSDRQWRKAEAINLNDVIRTWHILCRVRCGYIFFIFLSPIHLDTLEEDHTHHANLELERALGSPYVNQYCIPTNWTNLRWASFLAQDKYLRVFFFRLGHQSDLTRLSRKRQQ